ncbi:MAG: FecR family protein [Bacteroidetes bacterium]|nr:FecR family protein [Bacteroidota bacterium]
MEDYYKILTHSFLSNNISDEEVNILIEWLKSSDENKKQFLDYKRIYFLSLNADVVSKFEKEKIEAWDRLYSEINLEDSAEEDTGARRTVLFKQIMKIAAMFILFFGMGSLFTYFIFPSKLNGITTPKIVHEVVIPKGSKGEVILPDGTKVWLNANSKLKYDGEYGITNRNVSLQGEGYFKVKKNPSLIFAVFASGMKVKALGTTFNVKSYPDEKYFSTTLVEGSVKIEGKNIDCKLKPNQIFTCNKVLDIQTDESNKIIDQAGESKVDEPIKVEAENPNILSDIKVEVYTSWKDDQWIINSESLSDIVVLLERKFNVSVDIKSKELLNYKFSGTFKKETLEQILNVIRLTAPMKYEIKDGVVKMDYDSKRNINYQDVIK